MAIRPLAPQSQLLTKETIYNTGLLKKASNGVLALVPCSRTTSTLRAQKWLRAC